MTNIYKITNKLTGQGYVGKTIFPIEKRFKEHCICYPNNHTYIDNAIKQHGSENFTVELIMCCPDDEWKYWEQYYIKEYKTHWTDGGYNLSRGGDRNPMEDPEVRRRHAAACASEEHRRKQREKALLFRHSPESKAKMSRIQKEVYKDPELRRKVKLSQPTIKPVEMLDDDENVIMRFDSLSDACKYLGKNAGYTSGISNVIDKRNKNGKRSKFIGYAWRSWNKV